MFSLCSHGFSLGSLVSPIVKTRILGLSPVSTFDQLTGSESGVGTRALRCGCPLLLRDGVNCGDQISMYTLKYLYLSLP